MCCCVRGTALGPRCRALGLFDLASRLGAGLCGYLPPAIAMSAGQRTVTRLGPLRTWLPAWRQGGVYWFYAGLPGASGMVSMDPADA